MIQNIRLNTFETNSSSIHAMVICEGNEQNKLWEEGKLYTNYTGKLKTKDDLLKQFEKEKDEYIKEYREDEGYSESDEIDDEDLFESWLTYTDYKNIDTWYEELEQDTTVYTTKSGDEVIIHCAYGHEY